MIWAGLNPDVADRYHQIVITDKPYAWNDAVARGFALARRLEPSSRRVKGNVWTLELTELGANTLDAATGRGGNR